MFGAERERWTGKREKERDNVQRDNIREITKARSTV